MTEKMLTPARHEPTDVSTRFIWIGMALLLVSVFSLALLVFALFPDAVTDRTIHLPLAQYPDPQLQPSARADMAKFRAEELQRLNSTGWIDKTHGIVHISIADAMRKIAQEGIPGWPTPQVKRP